MRLIRRFFPVLLILAVFLIWKYRQDATKDKKVTINGETMGTFYNIIYLHPEGKILKPGIDSLLLLWNRSLSTYIPDSEISEFNKKDSLVYRSEWFYPVILKSREVWEASGGAFDPTVMPLVNAWGFGPAERIFPDSAKVDSILQYVGFDKIQFDSHVARKKLTCVQLDFSAIAKGYGVDVVGEYIHSQGVENFLVEIGGEIVCRGLNEKGKPWTTGIEDPTVIITKQKISAVLELSNKAIATSGNYRNFYLKDGKKYSHTINPFTGYPVEHSLLSASVIADDCMTADAYATAFMVLGLEKSIILVNKLKNIDVYFIYQDDKGKTAAYFSEGTREILKSVNSNNN